VFHIAWNIRHKFAPGKFSINFAGMLKVQRYINMTFRATVPKIPAFAGGVTMVIT
jgi:hypothetical protein